MTIGEKIRMVRLSKRMSQQVLGTKCGIALPTVGNIEKDKDVSFRVLKKVCDELGLEIVVKYKETNENENDFIEKIDAEELEVVEP